MKGIFLHPSPKSGFTLLELMIVLVVTGIVMTLAAPKIGHGFQGAQLKSSARHFAAALRAARSLAVTEHARVSAGIPIGGSEYYFIAKYQKKNIHNSSGDTNAPEESSGYQSEILQEPMRLGEGVFFLQFHTDSEAERRMDDGIIEFFPKGNSTGGTIVLAIESGAAYAVTVDRLTGRVTTEAVR